ncbi:MAG: ORF6N domain-containing protein [Elusimicrobia bacterium]|nr:ORF6N domain-containing protein [Elusimicrobiota bacterium]
MTIKSKMKWVRGRLVLVDRDLAEYFQVDLKTLRVAVNRHRNHFPPDALIVFNGDETKKFDGITAEAGRRQRRRAWGFTELGVNLLAGLLKSDRAVAHSIETIRKGFADFDLLRSLRL